MGKIIKNFKSLEEQESYFLEHFYQMTPSERLQALAKLQLKNNPNFLCPSKKLITIKKHFLYGH